MTTSHANRPESDRLPLGDRSSAARARAARVRAAPRRAAGTTAIDLRRRRRAPRAPAPAPSTIGFIFVGPKDDFGYNQAAYEGARRSRRPSRPQGPRRRERARDDDRRTAAEQMIDQGAKIIFATSYGHLDSPSKVAAAHPDVVVVQQGNSSTRRCRPTPAPTSAPCTSRCTSPASPPARRRRPNKLGYVYAFPIPQTLPTSTPSSSAPSRSTRRSKTYIVNTSNWCDPAKQAEAAKSLLRQGVDVITQHQDCTETIIKAAEAAGKYSVGYHADAQSLAPKGWITGSEWDWGPLYTDIVRSILTASSPAASTTPTTRSASRARRSRRRWSSRRTARRSTRRRRR